MEARESKYREDRARRKLSKQGIVVRKSRAQAVTANNFGDYMLVNARRNAIIAGARYELTLEDIERYASDNA